jgi:hypothetical protein
MVNWNSGVLSGINGIVMHAVGGVSANVMATAKKQGPCRVISCPVSLLLSIEFTVAKLVNASRNIMDKVYSEIC